MYQHTHARTTLICFACSNVWTTGMLTLGVATHTRLKSLLVGVYMSVCIQRVRMYVRYYLPMCTTGVLTNVWSFKKCGIDYFHIIHYLFTK